jgi:hypothetical protein
LTELQNAYTKILNNNIRLNWYLYIKINVNFKVIYR